MMETRLLPLGLLFLKLPFAIRPGLTDSRVSESEGVVLIFVILLTCDIKLITVQGSSVKQWVYAQYTGLVSWVIISTFHLGLGL